MTALLSRRSVLAGSAALGLSAPFVRPSRAASPGLRLGCLTDLNGPYADLSGKGSVAAIKLAIEDFAMLRPDIPVDLLVADFSLKPDVGLGIMGDWFDNKGVDAVLDIPMSALALAAARVFEEKNKVGLVTSAATSKLTREGCGPNHVQFSSDTFALAAALVKTIVKQGGDSWFFLYPNYELGKSMVGDASRAATESGAKVLGSVGYAFPGTNDFSSYLLQAQSSGAKVICLANAGQETVASIKQAREFGLLNGGTVLAIPFMGEPAIASLGLEAAQGIYFSTPFYWEQTAGTRAFADRWQAIVPNQRPNKNFANAYAGALHYLKVAAAMGVEAAKADGRAAIAQMKVTPTDDTLFGRASIRADGQAMHDMLLLKIKAPAESREIWDFCQIVGTLPAEQATRPLHEGGCKLIPA